MKDFSRIFIVSLSLAALLFGFTACSNMLEVDNPSSLTDEDLQGASQLDFLFNSAAGNVLHAFPRVILANGLVSDDLMPGSSQTAYKELDQGIFNILNHNRDFDIEQVYNLLSRARWVATTSVEKMKESSTENPNDIRIAKALTYEAFSYMLLAENFEEVTLDGQAPISDTDTYQLAFDRLAEALAIASANNDAFKVNIIGLLARANYSRYADTGDNSYFNQAVNHAQSALALEPDFAFEGIYDPTHQPNYVLSATNISTLPQTPEHPFLDRKDIFSGNDEPRTPTGPFKENSPDGNPVHNQLKYPTLSTPIPLVKWQEMNLILAENELKNGTIANALTFMNKNRDVVGLPDLVTADTDPDGEALDFLIYERASEFWLEGRRWMDMRQFNIPFSRWIPKSVTDGTKRKFGVGITERNTNDYYNN